MALLVQEVLAHTHLPSGGRKWQHSSHLSLAPSVGSDVIVCVFLFSAGTFGSRLLVSSPLPSPEPVADSSTGYHGNSTSPSPSTWTENVTAIRQDHSTHDLTHSTPAATTGLFPGSTSSQAPPTQSYTLPPDWLTSVTSLSTTWPVSSTAAPDSGISSTRQEAAVPHGKYYYRCPSLSNTNTSVCVCLCE